MIIRIIITTSVALCLQFCCYAQKDKPSNPSKVIYELLMNKFIQPKDTVAIYALNFKVSITKVKGKSVTTNIEANDSLAYTMFPNYKKIAAINLDQFLGNKQKISLIIPLLIYGKPYNSIKHKDDNNRTLIDFNAAVNAAFALYNPFKYNNLNDGKESLSHLMFRDDKRNKNEDIKSDLSEFVILDPLIIQFDNIK